MKADRSNEMKRKKTCLAVTAAVILAIVLLIVILSQTVFKAKHPTTTVNSVTLDDLDVSFDIARLRVNLNVTLDVDLSVKNPNKVGFIYTNSSATLNYRGQQVGEVPIPAGKISADDTNSMNLTLTIMADRLLSNSRVYSDALGGELPFNTHTRISGKVKILSIKVHVVSYASCDFTVFVSNRSVGNQVCQYKTKL